MATTVTLASPDANVTCSPVPVDQLMTLLDSRHAAASIHVTVFLSLLCALGTLGNFLTVVVSARRRQKSTATIFVLTLAVVDLVVCVVVLPLKLYELHHGTLTGPAWCRVNPYLTAASLLSPTLILLAAAADRYRAVCRPVRHFSTRNPTIAAVGVGAALLGCVGAVPAIFTNGQVCGFRTGSACDPISLCDTVNPEMSRMYYGVLAAIFLSSAMVMGVLYALVYKYVRDLVQPDPRAHIRGVPPSHRRATFPSLSVGTRRSTFSSLRLGTRRNRVSALRDSTEKSLSHGGGRASAKVPPVDTRAAQARLDARRLTLALQLPAPRPSLPPSAVQHHFRVARLFLLVTSVFLVTWLPYWGVRLHGLVVRPAPPVLRAGVATKVREFFRHLCSMQDCPPMQDCPTGK